MIDFAYLWDRINQLLVQVFGEPDFSLENVLINDHRVLISKRIDACVHFIDQNSQSPPINSLAVPLVQ